MVPIKTTSPAAKNKSPTTVTQLMMLWVLELSSKKTNSLKKKIIVQK